MTSGKHTLGSCLCGTVRYEIAGPFNMLVHCHCSMCRKHHGGSFATFAAAPLMGFRWIGGRDNVATYVSSEKGRRSYCKTCGSVAPALLSELDLVVCPAGNLEGDLHIKPQAHWFAGSRAPWYEITDALPQHEEYPEEFGAMGVTRKTVEAASDVISGSCLCDTVAFELRGPPIRMMNCHCSRCRRGRSSAHATNLFYPADAFEFMRGADDVVVYKVPEATRFAVAFCRRCGSAAPRVSREFNHVVVPAGSLDTDPGARPQAHIHVGSKASWFEITDDLPTYEAGPPP